MINIFISMPMRGRSTEKVRSDMKLLGKLAISMVAKEFNVQEDRCNVLDTLVKDPCPADNNAPIWYLGDGIKEYMSKTDVLALSSDWEPTRKCVIEKLVAEKYDIPIIVLPPIERLSIPTLAI